MSDAPIDRNTIASSKWTTRNRSTPR